MEMVGCWYEEVVGYPAPSAGGAVDPEGPASIGGVPSAGGCCSLAAEGRNKTCIGMSSGPHSKHPTSPQQ